MIKGNYHGDNTDGQCLVDAIRALNWPLENANILIIGAGGATRGVIYPLAQAGAKKIVIANRTLVRAEQLVADLQNADRKSTRLNSSHVKISYAVFCLKKKKTQQE